MNVIGHERSGSKVKVNINGKEKAGGLMPTSSCFIFHKPGLICCRTLMGCSPNLSEVLGSTYILNTPQKAKCILSLGVG